MNKLFLAAVLLVACETNPRPSDPPSNEPSVTARNPKMVAAIEDQGFKDVELEDYGLAMFWDGCGKDDTLVAHAKATNAFGKRVELVACSGLFFKGVTVRTR